MAIVGGTSSVGQILPEIRHFLFYYYLGHYCTSLSIFFFNSFKEGGGGGKEEGDRDARPGRYPICIDSKADTQMIRGANQKVKESLFINVHYVLLCCWSPLLAG